MLRVYCFVTLAFICGCGLAAGPVLPHIPNDFWGTLRRAIASQTENRVMEFLEARDYEGNRISFDNLFTSKLIFRYDKGLIWNINEPWNCTTSNVTQEYNKNRYFLPAYDPGTNHLQDTMDEFNLYPNNYSFQGNTTTMGIPSMQFNAFFDVPGGVGSTCTASSKSTNATWFFAGDDAVFYNDSFKNRPLQAQLNVTFYDCVGGHYQVNGTVMETLSFLDFHAERPFWMAFDPPRFQYCAELNQTAIPVLPPAFRHVTEHAEYPRQRVSYDQFTYDYNANKMKFSGWRPGGYIDTILLDVNNLQVYNYTFNTIMPDQPPTCNVQVPNKNDNFSFVSRIINWNTHPPHLTRFTESFIVDRSSTNWLYAGHMINDRGMWCEVWFQPVNFSTFNPNHFQHIQGYDAWYFLSDGWNVTGINESRVAVGMLRYGTAYNNSLAQSVNFSDVFTFTDIQYGMVDPRELEVPPFCPGGVQHFHGNYNGAYNGVLSANGAVGLSIGLILFGVLIGGGVTCFIRNKNQGGMTSGY